MGPYIVDKFASKGVYYLQAMDGEVLYASWNTVHLELFYKWMLYVIDLVIYSINEQSLFLLYLIMNSLDDI